MSKERTPVTVLNQLTSQRTGTSALTNFPTPVTEAEVLSQTATTGHNPIKEQPSLKNRTGYDKQRKNNDTSNVATSEQAREIALTSRPTPALRQQPQPANTARPMSTPTPKPC